MNTCSAHISRPGDWHSSRCGRKARVGDKCSIHCDAAIKKRRDKATAFYHEKIARRRIEQIEAAILLLRQNGYSVGKVDGPEITEKTEQP